MTPNPDDIKSFNEQTATVNGHTYNYVDEGDKSKQALILLHGFPDLWYGWHKVIPGIVDAGYRVIAIDCLGYGGSSKPDKVEEYGFKSLSNDVIELAKVAGAHKPIVVGHDWGGALALRVPLWRPNDIAGVVSVGTPYWPPAPEFYPLEVLVKMMPMLEYQVWMNTDDAEHYLNAHIEQMFNCCFRYVQEGFDLHKNSGNVVEKSAYKDSVSKLLSPSDRQYYIDQFKKNGIRGPLQWYRLHKVNFDDELAGGLTKDFAIKLPALLIHGAADPVLTIDMTNGMEANIPQLKRNHLDGVGHWVMYEAPDRFLSALIDWLKEQKF